MKAESLQTIVTIRDFLDTQHSDLMSDQFALDWCERYIDRANEILYSEGIENTDDEFRGAIHYESQTILAVIRTNVRCYRFFVELERRTRIG